MAKERSNRKFDFSKSDVSRFDFTKDEKEELEVAPGAPAPNSNQSNLDKIFEYIKYNPWKSFAVAAVVAAICLLGYGYYTDINQTEKKTEIIAGDTNDETADGGTTDGGAAAAGTTDGGTADGGTINNSSIALSGTLEQKVKEVIRGKYGNGEIRKQKLGDQYSEIQSKVNEMYRNGLVK